MEKWQTVDQRFEFIQKVFDVENKIAWPDNCNNQTADDGTLESGDVLVFDLDKDEKKWSKICRRFCE